MAKKPCQSPDVDIPEETKESVLEKMKDILKQLNSLIVDYEIALKVAKAAEHDGS